VIDAIKEAGIQGPNHKNPVENAPVEKSVGEISAEAKKNDSVAGHFLSMNS